MIVVGKAKEAHGRAAEGATGAEHGAVLANGVVDRFATGESDMVAAAMISLEPLFTSLQCPANS